MLFRSGPTRTEADFLAHVQALINTASEVRRWHIVCDQLNTHQSASLVEWVASRDQLQVELGVKGKSGILASMASRAAFLSDPTAGGTAPLTGEKGGPC